MKKQLSDEEFLKALGQKLRLIRESKGWTLEQTEEHGWKSWRHLQRIETGKNITLITLRRIAEFYEIKISKILDI